MNKKFFWGTGLTLGVALFIVQGDVVSGQETKQLKEISPAGVEVKDQTTGPADESKPDSNDADQAGRSQNDLPANGGVQSYSVVTENRLGPDGQRIQRKKVWKNGVLVEDKEEIFDGADDEESFSAEIDGELLPGTVSRSERNGNGPFDSFDDMNLGADMSETLKKMEENFQNQRAYYDEMMRRFGAKSGFPSGMRLSLFPNRIDDPSGMAVPVQLSEYWIGASVSPVPPELAYQLNLPEGEGLFIRDIVPDSPAEKAGLARFDILMKLGEETVTDMTQIGRLVDQAKGTPLTVEYLRKGTGQTAELTPEKRPEQDVRLGADLSVLPAEETDAEAVRREQIRVVRPGMIVPSDQAADASLDAQTETPPPSTSDNETSAESNAAPAP